MSLPYTHVCFSASGTKGLIYEGIMEALEDDVPDFEGWARSVTGIAGTSGGAIMALLFALRIPRAMRREMMLWLADKHNWLAPDVGMLVQRYGVDDGSRLCAFVRHALTVGGLSPMSTMADLQRLLRVDVVLVAHDLLRAEPVYLSASTTPAMSVADAVLASCAIPLVFLPVWHDGLCLVDGFLSEHIPAVFGDAPHVLHVTVPFSPPRTELNGWFDYVGSLTAAVIRAQRARMSELFASSSCICASHPLTATTGTLDSFDAAQVESWLRCGYAVGLAWRRRTLTATLFHLVVRYVECITPVERGGSLESEDESEPDPGSG